MKLSKSLGIPFSFHDLRHTHATLMLEAEANVKVVQQRLGHSSIQTTLDVYVHVNRAMEDGAVDKFEQALFSPKSK